MESNTDKLKEIDMKNHKRYYFDEIICITDINLENYLSNEELYKNILIYDVAYKTPYGAKPSSTIFDKVEGYI